MQYLNSIQQWNMPKYIVILTDELHSRVTTLLIIIKVIVTLFHCCYVLNEFL